MPERFIDGPQGRLLLSETEGDGVPLLFIHGDGGNHHHWDRVRRDFVGRASAAFDRRGHGKSDLPESGSHSHHDAIADITAVADALDYERYILVGHSGGALSSFACASHEPDRLLGLVLVDPPPDPAVLPSGMIEETLSRLETAYDETVRQYYAQIAGEHRAVVERVLRDALDTPRATIIGAVQAMAQFKPAYYLNYKGPALSIIQPQNDVGGALHRIAHFEQFAIDGAGHWIHLAMPELFHSVLDDFIVDHEHPPTPGGGSLGAERRPD